MKNECEGNELSILDLIELFNQQINYIMGCCMDTSDDLGEMVNLLKACLKIAIDHIKAIQNISTLELEKAESM